MNRKRKSDRDKGIAGEVDDQVADQVVEHASMATDVLESIAEPSGMALEILAPAPAPDQSSIIFMEPLLPPAEALPLQQSEMSEFPSVPPRDIPLLSYEAPILDVNVIVDTADPGEVDIEASQQTNTKEASAEEPCPDHQEASEHGQQDIPSVVWRSAVSPVSSISGSDSTSSNSAMSSGARSRVTMGANTTSCPTTPTVSTASTSTSTAHIQPQFPVPYYMPPPFSLPYTSGQGPFLIPGPYSPMPYPLRPSYTYGTPAPSPFQAYQYAPAPPPPGQMAPYALRPYPYPPWVPYANGSIEANWFDTNAQAHVQTQVQTKPQRAKRGWGVADQPPPCEDGLRIVMVQPKGFDDIDVASSPASSVTSASASESRPMQTIPEPSLIFSPQSSADDPHAEASSAEWRATATNPAPAVSAVFVRPFYATRSHGVVLLFQRSCSSESCRRQIPTEAPGALCERCKVRLKKRLEQTKRRLKLEPRKTRPESRRLMV